MNEVVTRSVVAAIILVLVLLVLAYANGQKETYLARQLRDDPQGDADEADLSSHVTALTREQERVLSGLMHPAYNVPVDRR
jgi:hypothetical protein